MGRRIIEAQHAQAMLSVQRRNSDVQLGFGPTLSLFGDAIVLGGGFNLRHPVPSLAVRNVSSATRLGRAGLLWQCRPPIPNGGWIEQTTGELTDT
jgi:hypothetical protein